MNWHNPHNLDTAGDGWRFLRPGEFLPADTQMWACGWIAVPIAHPALPNFLHTYRTQAPDPWLHRCFPEVPVMIGDVRLAIHALYDADRDGLAHSLERLLSLLNTLRHVNHFTTCNHV